MSLFWNPFSYVQKSPSNWKNIIPEITSTTRNIRISVLRMDLLMMLLYQGNFLTKMKFDLCDKITTSYIGSIYFLLLLYFGSLSLSERSSFLAWAQLIVLWLPCLWQRLQLCIVFCILLVFVISVACCLFLCTEKDPRSKVELCSGLTAFFLDWAL